MCGRFTLHHEQDEVVERFGVASVEFALRPRYNIAPSQAVAVVVGQDERRLAGFKWGLVPFWAKESAIGNKLINAKAETLAEKPSFKYALSKRRCLIPSDGFYEWKKSGKGPSQPLYLRRRDRGLFAFAGLWEEWQQEDGSPLHTCTIITVEPNQMMRTIHHRMAAILQPEEEAVWLDAKTPEPRLLELLRPYPGDDLEAIPVSRQVNSPATDDPSCIAAL
jgi:putative SOS response-associated peptidase YedK